MTSDISSTDIDSSTDRMTERRHATREAIIHALARVVVNNGISEFSVQSVADEAGVSHRTVYRYFSSREALLEGLTEHLDEWMRSEGLPGIPSQFEELVDVVPTVCRFFDEHALLVEAMVVASLALRVEPASRQARTQGFIDTVAREAPNLTQDESLRWGLSLRSVASSQHWYTLTRRYGLDSSDAIAVTQATLRAMIAEIRRIDSSKRDHGGGP